MPELQPMPEVRVPQEALADWGKRWLAESSGRSNRFDKSQAMEFGHLFDQAFGAALATMLGGIPVVTPHAKALIPPPRFPFCIVAFIVVLPGPAVPGRQLRATASTLQRLGSKKDELDQHHLAEAIALVLWESARRHHDGSACSGIPHSFGQSASCRADGICGSISTSATPHELTVTRFKSKPAPDAGSCVAATTRPHRFRNICAAGQYVIHPTTSSNLAVATAVSCGQRRRCSTPRVPSRQ